LPAGRLDLELELRLLSTLYPFGNKSVFDFELSIVRRTPLESIEDCVLSIL
jgi:hypothetical protein